MKDRDPRLSNEETGCIIARIMKDKSVVVEMSGHLTGALIKGHILRAIYLTYARNYKRELLKEAEVVRKRYEGELKNAVRLQAGEGREVVPVAQGNEQESGG